MVWVACRGMSPIANEAEMLSPRASDIKRIAWQRAYDVHIRRAFAVDGSAKKYASRLADRFWPIYAADS